MDLKDPYCCKRSRWIGKFDSIEAHTKTELLLLHHSVLDDQGQFLKADTWINLKDEPNHQELCSREQRYFLKAIKENLDMSTHVEDAVNSLMVAFACDNSVRMGKTMIFKE